MAREHFTTFIDPDGERPRMLPRIGKIGLGVKRKSAKTGKEYPSEVDYWALDDPTAHVIIAASLKAGKIDEARAAKWKRGEDGPKTLPILFTAEDPALVAPKALECWGNAIKLCSGNGQWAEKLAFSGGKDSPPTLERIECPCDLLDTGKCKRQMRLMVLIPHVSIRGCFQIDTTSRASIGNVYSDLQNIAQMFGRISWLLDPDDGEPLLAMTREPWKSTTDGKVHFAIRIQARDIPLRQLAAYRGLFFGQAQSGTVPQRMLPQPGAEQPRSQNGSYLNGQPAPALPDDSMMAPPEGVDLETGEILPDDPGEPIEGDWAPPPEDEDLNPSALMDDEPPAPHPTDPIPATEELMF